MAKMKSKQKREETTPLRPDTMKSIWFVVLFGLAIIFILAGTGQAGPIGNGFFGFFGKLFGWGYWLLPALSLLVGFVSLASDRRKLLGSVLIGGIIFILSALGLIDIISPGNGGWAGVAVGALKIPFGTPASVVITITALVVSFLVIVNRPLKLNLLNGKKDEEEEELEINIPEEPPANKKIKNPPTGGKEKNLPDGEEGDLVIDSRMEMPKAGATPRPIRNYVAPPLDLLTSTTEKPTIGDLRANANVIKRTLDGFGIPVEMGEINVGPTVTRYTLKPAEGIKLSRITALNQDLAMSLAAHPIRIEAPIPGKSLVGIEVPNKAAAVVRLGSLLLYPESKKSGQLSFALGRNVSGEPIFKDIERMPHLLVAGATGSGKSIMIHSIIMSLLYKNSPEMLRFIMIDPKRVELSIYNGIPHLLSPVITENKKSIAVLRWAIQEMDRRYKLLLGEGSRDITSYNKSGKNSLPYLIIVIDELADLMTSYGHEVEGSIIRLAQMARATGIHLIVSTQRPSVEVITGLIKANITSRIALQVASQIDSRTILDAAGAEKLLGHGDALFTSAELSKPLRVQGAYLTEEEIKKVTEFIKKNNESTDDGINVSTGNGTGEENQVNLNFDDFDTDGADELLEEAIETVRAAKKASASLLQRRLKVGYARAARLLDIMEEKGVIGPGDGAKPREVYNNGEENGE